MSGQPLAVAALIGLSTAKIGEFSFIVAGLGLSLEVMNPLLYSLAISVSVVTTATIPYLIRLAACLEGRSPA